MVVAAYGTVGFGLVVWTPVVGCSASLVVAGTSVDVPIVVAAFAVVPATSCDVDIVIGSASPVVSAGWLVIGSGASNSPPSVSHADILAQVIV